MKERSGCFRKYDIWLFKNIRKGNVLMKAKVRNKEENEKKLKLRWQNLVKSRKTTSSRLKWIRITSRKFLHPKIASSSYCFSNENILRSCRHQVVAASYILITSITLFSAILSTYKYIERIWPFILHNSFSVVIYVKLNASHENE